MASVLSIFVYSYTNDRSRPLQIFSVFSAVWAASWLISMFMSISELSRNMQIGIGEIAGRAVAYVALALFLISPVILIQYLWANLEYTRATRPKAAPIVFPRPVPPPPKPPVAAPPEPPVSLPPKPPESAQPGHPAPEGFTVEDVFLMTKDGRCILHNARRLKPNMDAETVMGMLTAIQTFIKVNLGNEAGAELGSMEYGGNKFLLEMGKRLVVAAAIIGEMPPDFRDRMKASVNNIEAEYAAVLHKWDGTISKFEGAKRFLEELWNYERPVKPPESAPKVEVDLKSELEFYQGYVRLKVAVKNRMPTTITEATFKLVFDPGMLRLDKVEPENYRKGDEADIGNVGPGEKKTVAFYLDPQICTESYVEGLLLFKDARGNLETLMMPRKLTAVVCPILITPENINTAMLKRMMAEELSNRDFRLFMLPPGIDPRKAFELAKAAVQHHDMRLVREFAEDEPYTGEAWYYGMVKGREDKLVVRASVRADIRVLEFYVASSSTLMLAGMLADLKSDLRKELLAQGNLPQMSQVTDGAMIDAVANFRPLLEKAPEQ